MKTADGRWDLTGSLNPILSYIHNI